MPPSPLSPSSRSALPAAADGDHDAAVSEHPCVTLVEWWLATVERDDQKIAVAGTFERNQTLQEYSSAPIVKCHTPSVLESEDGTILRIHGSHNVLRTYENGYSTKVCELFLDGFPDCWQSCKLQYPKLTNSHTECQPCSSNISNSGVDSIQFYLEKFEQGKRLHSYGTYLINKLHDTLESFSHKDAVLQKSSHLLNGTPRFEEYTGDGDIATNENAAASSEAASGDHRTPGVSLDVLGCCKEIQHISLTEKAAVDEETAASVYVDTQSSLCLSNRTPILEEDAAASNDDNERYTAISKEVDNMEIGLVTGSPSRERGHDDVATDVSLAPTVECTNNAVSEAVDSTPATDTYRKKTPVASLKNGGSSRENQHRASNKKAVGWPKKQILPNEKRQSATRSQGTRNAVAHVFWSPPTRGKDTSWSMTTVEALNLKRSRSGRVVVPKLDEGCQSIVYGRDGLIAGVIGLHSPATPKWSGSKTVRRKKRRTQ